MAANSRMKGRRRRGSLPHLPRSGRWFGFGALGVAAIAGVVVLACLRSGFDVSDLVESLHPEGNSSHWQAVVTEDDVNVRAGATTESTVIGLLMARQPVTVTGEQSGEYLPVNVDGHSGWVAADYLSGDLAVNDQGSGSAQIGGDADRVAAISATEPPVVALSSATVPPEPTPTEDTSVPLVEPTTEVFPTAAPALPAPGEPDPSNASEGAPAATDGERWIDVDRTTAVVTLYVGDQAQDSFQGKIGRDPAVDGFYSTAVGTYHVYSMQEGLSSTPFVEDVYLSDWVGFDPVRKNGFHSPVREADGSERVTQNPTTMGCVRLKADDAVSLFDFADIGMRVEIHD